MSMMIDILNMQGEKVGDYTIDDSCIELEKGAQAVHDAVVGFLAATRAGTACTKTRAEVAGSGKKPFRQKGGGRARAGETRNPVWRHGGVAFGPKPRDYSIKLNAKVQKLALKRAFSDALKEGSVVVLDSLTLADHKTKSFVNVLKALKLEDSKVLLTVPELYYGDNLYFATRNINSRRLGAFTASSVNTYYLIYADKLLFTKEALDCFLKRLA